MSGNSVSLPITHAVSDCCVRPRACVVTRTRRAPSATLRHGPGARTATTTRNLATSGRSAAAVDGDGTLPLPGSGSGSPSSALLAWLARVTDDPALESRIALRDSGDGRGRCLRALRNLSPGEVILNIPFRLVFSESAPAKDGGGGAGDESSSGADDMPWSALMAMRLLEERTRGGELAPWIASLPISVSTPPLEFTPRELAAAEDAAAEGEATSVAREHAAAAAAMKERLDAAGCTERDLRWATGVLHSRCFTHGPSGAHLAVPGVDMCNHCFEAPSAAVRVVTSPDNCQGTRASEEIAAPAAAARTTGTAGTSGGGGAPGDEDDLASGSGGGGGGDGDGDAIFQLCACEDGIEQDDEVTISYGPWPNDPFFLYFGFVPLSNPNDAVVLFDDVADVAACAERLGLLSTSAAAAAAAAAAAVERLRAAGSGLAQQQRQRMVVTREGVDYSVVEAAAALGLAGWETVVEGRCRELLREYTTTLKVDRALVSGAGAREDGRPMSQNEVTAIAYRMSKKEVLLGPLAAAAARAAAETAAAEATAGAPSA